jgi:hypothetical protein
VIWRWLAVMLALPTLVLILLMPEAWPVLLLGWGVLVVKGFGRAMGSPRTPTRHPSPPRSADGSPKARR